MIESRSIVEEYGRGWEDRKDRKRLSKEKPTKLYYVSSELYHPGQVVSFNVTSRSYLYLTTSSVPHESLFGTKLGKIENGEKWYVYEVAPIGGVRYGHSDLEVKVRQFEVVKIIGDANAILENHRKKHPKSIGSKTVGQLRLHGVKIEGLNWKKQKNARIPEDDELEKTW